MRTIESSDYHDYFIRDGQHIGEYEQMYKNVEDPWHCVALAGRLENDLLITMARSAIANPGLVLDVGCGLGELTARLAAAFPDATAYACDLSPTAVEKAGARFSNIHFFVHDLNGDEDFSLEPGSVDVLTMAQVMWCILPSLDKVMARLHRLLRRGGHLAMQQAFMASADQQYGRGIVETTADLRRSIEQAGFEVRSEVHIDPRPEPGRPVHLLLLARKS